MERVGAERLMLEPAGQKEIPQLKRGRQRRQVVGRKRPLRIQRLCHRLQCRQRATFQRHDRERIRRSHIQRRIPGLNQQTAHRLVFGECRDQLPAGSGRLDAVEEHPARSLVGQSGGMKGHLHPQAGEFRPVGVVDDGRGRFG